MKESEGTPRMKEIAAHVRKGAMAYLRQQYRVVAIVFLILVLFFAFLAYGLGVQNPWVPFAFLTGGLFSGAGGFYRDAYGDVRFGAYGPCRQPIAE